MPPLLTQNLVLNLKEFLINQKQENLILNQQDPATKQTIVALQRNANAVSIPVDSENGNVIASVAPIN